MTDESDFTTDQVLFPQSEQQKWWALCGQIGVLGKDGRGIATNADLKTAGFMPLRIDYLPDEELVGAATFAGIVSDPETGVRHIAMAGVMFVSDKGPDAPRELGWEPELGFGHCEFDHREDGAWVTAGTIGYLMAGSRSALPGARFGFGVPPWKTA